MTEEEKENWKQVQSLSELEIGDIITGHSGNCYVVTANYGSHVTAVHSQDVSNPIEWKVWKRKI